MFCNGVPGASVLSGELWSDPYATKVLRNLKNDMLGAIYHIGLNKKTYKNDGLRVCINSIFLPERLLTTELSEDVKSLLQGSGPPHRFQIGLPAYRDPYKKGPKLYVCLPFFFSRCLAAAFITAWKTLPGRLR